MFNELTSELTCKSIPLFTQIIPIGISFRKSKLNLNIESDQKA